MNAGTLLEKACIWIGGHLPGVTIYGADKRPYLTRTYLLGRDWKYFSVFLHKFHSSDPGVDTHNHPWAWSFSLILVGSYIEKRLLHGRSHRQPGDDNDMFRKKRFSPGSINFIDNSVFHRVTLDDEKKGMWTLFVAGPRTKEWGFRDKDGVFSDWRTNPDAIK
jgi:hypothetical protein